MALLDVKNLTKNFGGLTAVSDVTLELNEGELVGLIGPNGAGKTTLFNLLTGVYEPSEGTVTLDGHLLNGKVPYKIAAWLTQSSLADVSPLQKMGDLLSLCHTL